MLKLVSKSLLISLLAGSLAWALVFTPLPQDVGYAELQSICGQGNWLYHRIHEDDRPIDIAFLGSSRTMCGIHDSLLTGQLSRSLNHPVQVANLGTCFYGRNIQFTLIERLLERHNPQYVILEVRTKENKSLNKSFPILGKGEEFLSGSWAQTLISAPHHKQAWEGGRFRFRQFLKEQIDLEIPRITNDTTGYMHRFRNTQEMPPHNIPEKKDLQLPPDHMIASWEFERDQKMGIFYLQKIKDLLTQRGIKLILLYYPDYKDHADQKPLNEAFYREIADQLWLPPSEIVEPAEHYMDEVHLNGIGGWALSRWVCQQLSLTLLEHEN